MSTGLPNWYTSSGDSLTFGLIAYCEDNGQLDSDSIHKMIKEYQKNTQNLEDPQIKLQKIGENILILLVYSEELDHTNLLSDLDIKEIHTYHSYSKDFTHFVKLVETLNTQEEAFISSEQLVDTINAAPYTTIDNALVQLTTYFIDFSEDEIFFFYRINPEKAVQMRTLFTPFADLLQETIRFSEVIAARFLGVLSGPESEEIPNYIDNIDFLLEFLEEQNNRSTDRFAVLQSIMYRQLVPLENTLQLVERYTDLIHDTRKEDIVSFLLDQALSVSLAIFEVTFMKLSQLFTINSETIADIILQHGKGVEIVDKLDQNKKLENIIQVLETVMEPEAEDSDNNNQFNEF